MYFCTGSAGEGFIGWKFEGYVYVRSSKNVSSILWWKKNDQQGRI